MDSIYADLGTEKKNEILLSDDSHSHISHSILSILSVLS